MFAHVAVVGATGAVGRIMVQLLEERQFPLDRIRFLASSRSAGRSLRFRGKEYPVEPLTPEAFQGVDLVLSSTPDDVAREFLPAAVEAGAVVVDESAAWRMEPDVPLVVPEVNPHAVAHHKGLIASPNCSTTQLVVTLKPLHDAAGVRRVVVASYQAASGAGVAGSQELEMQTRAELAGQSHAPQAFPHPIAFNCIPQIGSIREAGYTSEEWKLVRETHKILEDESIPICATCVRIPVKNSHCEAVLVETERKLSAQEARELFRAAPGIEVIDDPAAGQYPLPRDCSGTDAVYVGRIREDLSCASGLAYWCVSDNLRKGAATNAIQIAELLLSQRGGKPAPAVTAARRSS